MTMDTTSRTGADTRADADAVQREQHELARILEVLAKLSAAQAAPLEEHEWAVLLEKKAVLIAEIDRRNIRVLFATTSAVVERLQQEGRSKTAVDLQQIAEANLNRLREIQATERAACEMMQSQVHDLRQILLAAGEHRRAKGAYRPAPPAMMPRFLDGAS